MLKAAAVSNTIQQSMAPTIKVGSTQIRPIINTSTPPAPQPVVISQPPVVKSDLVDINKSTAKDASAPATLSSTSTANTHVSTPVSRKCHHLKYREKNTHHCQFDQRIYSMVAVIDSNTFHRIALIQCSAHIHEPYT